MTQKRWNIWKVQNRWLRAITAWLLAAVLLTVAAAGLPILFALFFAIGACRGVREEFAGFSRCLKWGGIWSPLWAAMTGRTAS